MGSLGESAEDWDAEGGEEEDQEEEEDFAEEERVGGEEEEDEEDGEEEQVFPQFEGRAVVGVQLLASSDVARRV